MRAYSGSRMVVGMALGALVSGCGGSGSAPEGKDASLDGPGVRSALAAIRGDLIRQHMSTLADDALEGRGLGTPGYDGALKYVETTLKA